MFKKINEILTKLSNYLDTQRRVSLALVDATEYQTLSSLRFFVYQANMYLLKCSEQEMDFAIYVLKENLSLYNYYCNKIDKPEEQIQSSELEKFIKDNERFNSL